MKKEKLLELRPEDIERQADLVIPLYYSGWECDSKAFIFTPKGEEPFLVLTDHGRPYIGTTRRLKIFIDKYRQAITITEDAISKLRSTDYLQDWP